MGTRASGDTDYIIETEGLTRFYGSKPAVDHINFGVRQGGGGVRVSGSEWCRQEHC